MRAKKWTISLLLLCVLFLYVLIRFVANTNHIEEAVESLRKNERVKKEKAHFVLIAQELDNPYWRKVQQGAQNAAAAFDVQIEYVAPLRTSVDEQVKLLEKAIASQVDGIIVQGLDEQVFTPIINKAVAAHIPVVTIDTDAPISKRIAYVGTDNYVAGEQLGEAVVAMVGGEATIGIIVGSETSASQKLRLNGFLSVVAKHEKLKVVDILPSNISKIKASLQAESMLREHPSISVMVGFSALDGVGILNATKNLQMNTVKIFCFDDIEETLQAVSGDLIEATVIQKPMDMGFEAIKILYNYLNGKDPSIQNFTPVEVITKTTVYPEEQP